MSAVLHDGGMSSGWSDDAPPEPERPAFRRSFAVGIGAALGLALVAAGLALLPAYQMVTEMAVDIPGITFQVPWTELGLASGLAFGMTLLTTWLPSVQASQVTPAEALRYE